MTTNLQFNDISLIVPKLHSMRTSITNSSFWNLFSTWDSQAADIFFLGHTEKVRPMHSKPTYLKFSDTFKAIKYSIAWYVQDLFQHLEITHVEKHFTLFFF